MGEDSSWKAGRTGLVSIAEFLWTGREEGRAGAAATAARGRVEQIQDKKANY